MEPAPTEAGRFDEFKELDDKSGFKIPSGEVFKFDKFGGWFDEYGDYFNSEGVHTSDVPKDSLKEKKKLMEDQRLMTKVKNKKYHQLENEDIPEYYDVVGAAVGVTRRIITTTTTRSSTTSPTPNWTTTWATTRPRTSRPTPRSTVTRRSRRCTITWRSASAKSSR